MNWKNWMAALVAAVALSACGGGGGGNPAFGSGEADGESAGSGSSEGDGSSGSSGDGSVTSNTSGSVVIALSSNTVSATTSANVTALVKDANNAPSAGVLVTFGLAGSTSSIGQLSPLTAITNSQGLATTVLSPAVGTSSGAAYVTASADVGVEPLTSRQAFTVSASSVTLDSIAASPATINGYASSVLTIAVTGASVANPVTVKVSSPCSDAGTAVISPATLTLTSSPSTVTYLDKACGTTDRITAQIQGTALIQRTDIIVSPPSTTGIQFTSVDNPNICLAGTGCPSNANVIFKVVDATGAGKAGVRVNFSLDTSIAAFADLGSTYGLTGANGTVAVTVSSKQTPTPLRVTAQVDGTALQTVSNELRISGGLPVASMDSAHSGLSLSATQYSLNGNKDGDFADVSIRLSDRFGAPAIDGTAVSFVSDGGSVVPASCTTVDGICSVKLIVANPRPLTGRVHLIAYVKGQEYFVDLDSDGSQGGGETYDDVPVGVCLDKNEDAVCAADEFIVGVSVNPDLGNGAWDGNGSAFARQQALFYFSSTTTAPRLYQANNGVCTNTLVTDAYMTVTMGTTSARQYLEICVSDGNTNADSFGKNPLVSGAILSGLTTVENVTLSVSNSPVPASVDGPTYHLVTVTNTKKPLAAVTGGTADLTIEMDGQSVTFNDLITILP